MTDKNKNRPAARGRGATQTEAGQESTAPLAEAVTTQPADAPPLAQLEEQPPVAKDEDVPISTAGPGAGIIPDEELPQLAEMGETPSPSDNGEGVQFPDAPPVVTETKSDAPLESDEVSEHLPRWKSHKVVEAFKIESVRLAVPAGTEDDGNRLLLGRVPHTGEQVAARVNVGYTTKYPDAVGGYFVRYPDGYESWSPAPAFEAGYIHLPGLRHVAKPFDIASQPETAPIEGIVNRLNAPATVQRLKFVFDDAWLRANAYATEQALLGRALDAPQFQHTVWSKFLSCLDESGLAAQLAMVDAQSKAQAAAELEEWQRNEGMLR